MQIEGTEPNSTEDNSLPRYSTTLKTVNGDTYIENRDSDRLMDVMDIQRSLPVVAVEWSARYGTRSKTEGIAKEN